MLGLFLLTVTNVVFADTISCEQCSVEKMFDVGKARVYGQTYRGAHPPVYVVNLHDNAVIKLMYAHNVDRTFDWEVDEFKRWAVEGLVEPPIRDEVAKAHGKLLARRGRLHLSSGGGNPTSVYEVIHDPALELRVSYEIGYSWEGFHKGLLDPFVAFNPVKGFQPAALTVTAKVVFADKSTANYQFDQSKDLWVRVPGTARDAEGNLVPEKKADVDGDGIRKYNFRSETSPAYLQFVDVIVDYGIKVERRGNGGGRITVVCAGNTCRIRRVGR